MNLEFLLDYYQGKHSPKQLFISQLKEVESYTGIDLVSKTTESIEESYNDVTMILDLRSRRFLTVSILVNHFYV